VQFYKLDAHNDLWLTEKKIRSKHPEKAPSLIADCNAKYQPTEVISERS
jgi:hypothetical protein